MVQTPETVTVVRKEGSKAVFEIGPLMPGYGATIANPLRRVLLSALEGSAVTSVKVKGVDHEFTAIPGVMEDVILIVLNLKKLRFRVFSEEPVVITLSAKGEGVVTAAGIKLTSDVELINPEVELFTISEKKTSVELEITVQKGRGYLSVEQRLKDKLPIGVIAVDAVFSPVRVVNFTIEDVRVGQRIDFNKVVMEVETDGSVQPEAALREAAKILNEHFSIVAAVEVPEAPAAKPAKKQKKEKAKKE